MIYPEWQMLLTSGIALALAIVYVIAGLIGCYRATRGAESRKLLHILALMSFTALISTAGVLAEVIAKREGSRLLMPVICPLLALGFALMMIRALLLANARGKPGGPADPGSGDAPK